MILFLENILLLDVPFTDPFHSSAARCSGGVPCRAEPCPALICPARSSHCSAWGVKLYFKRRHHFIGGVPSPRLIAAYQSHWSGLPVPIGTALPRSELFNETGQYQAEPRQAEPSRAETEPSPDGAESASTPTFYFPLLLSPRATWTILITS